MRTHVPSRVRESVRSHILPIARITVSASAFCLLFAVCLPAAPARAQDRGSIVTRGMRPYTETMRKMVLRDEMNQALRLPHPPIIVAPPEQEDDADDKLQQDPNAPRGVFQAPEFRGYSGGISIQSVNGFAGISLQDEFNAFPYGFIPPDTTGAIGPNHFLETLNGGVAVYSRAGSRLSFVTLDSFFTVPSTYPTAGTVTTDPRLIYDRRAKRWFACSIDTRNTDNKLCLAVSRTSDPTGTWDKYVFSAGDSSHFGDWPTLGLDDNGVYFGVSEFGSSSPTPRILVTRKATLIAATPTLGTVTAFDPADMYSAPMPPLNFDTVGASDPAWFFAASRTVFGNVQYAKLTWSGATPTLSGVSTLTTPAYAGWGPHAPSKGTGSRIETGDDRLLMGMTRNHRFWTARNVGVDYSGSTTTADRCACEWLEIDVSGAAPTLVQTGRVFDTATTSPRFYYYPAIAVNGQGHATIGFSGSSANDYVSSYYCQRLASDTAGSMGPITQIRAGGAAYYQDFGYGRVRWGDYSLTSVDPNDDMTLWTLQEHATSSTNIWGTWVLPTLAPAPTMTNPAAKVYPGQQSATFDIAGTGFYDPGAGFASRPGLQVTGGTVVGIANAAVTVVSPSHITVTFNVDSNASSGFRSITLTNPDGQQASVANAIQVVAPPPTAAYTPNPATATVPHDGSVLTGTASLTLDGSSSSDPGGRTITFVWKDGDGNVVGTDSTLPLTLTAGSYTYSLTVTNSDGFSNTVSIPVTISPEPNAAPVAVPPGDFSIAATHGGNPAADTASVLLDGSGSYDPDGDSLVARWFEGQTLLGENAKTTANLSIGTHLLTLGVTDPYLAHDQGYVTVTVTAAPNQNPNAYAGPNQHINSKVTTKVQLDGTGSSDPDGDSLVSYVWKEGATQIATGAQPAVYLDPGIHTITLTVTDTYGGSGSSDVTITVDPRALTAVKVSSVTVHRGQMGTVTARLRAGTKLLMGKPLTFMFDGQEIFANVSSGDPTLVKFTPPSSLGLGTHFIRVRFDGDLEYQPSSGDGTLTIKK